MMSRITTRFACCSPFEGRDVDVGYYPVDHWRAPLPPVGWEALVLVVVRGGVQYPGDDVVDSGSSELSRVVALAELFDHPCGRIGERVVGEGDGAAFARCAGRVGAVLSEYCVDPSFVAGDAQLISRLVDCRAGLISRIRLSALKRGSFAQSTR